MMTYQMEVFGKYSRTFVLGFDRKKRIRRKRETVRYHCHYKLYDILLKAQLNSSSVHSRLFLFVKSFLYSCEKSVNCIPENLSLHNENSLGLHLHRHKGSRKGRHPSLRDIERKLKEGKAINDLNNKQIHILILKEY